MSQFLLLKVLIGSVFCFMPRVLNAEESQLVVVPQKSEEAVEIKEEKPDSKAEQFPQDFFVFAGWAPRIPNGEKKHYIIKKIENHFKDKETKSKDQEKTKLDIRNITNNYIEVKDSLKPVFDSAPVAEEIVELLKKQKPVILIGYSEGALSLINTVIRILDTKNDQLPKGFEKLLKIYLIDPPIERLFTRFRIFDIHSYVYVSVGITADFVQWLCGLSPDKKLSDRKFPLLSDAFLWCFRQFWKYFLVPISHLPFCIHKFKIIIGEDRMFNRTLFSKSRAKEFEKNLNDLPTEKAGIIKQATVLYLQNWQQDEKKTFFEKIGMIKQLPNNKRLNHLTIFTPAIDDILKSQEIA